MTNTQGERRRRNFAEEQLCAHRDRPQITQETSYEWLTSMCSECWAEARSKQRQYDLAQLAREADQLELNKYGKYSAYRKDTTGRSGTGRWLLGAIALDELPMWTEAGGPLP